MHRYRRDVGEIWARYRRDIAEVRGPRRNVHLSQGWRACREVGVCTMYRAPPPLTRARPAHMRRTSGAWRCDLGAWRCDLGAHLARALSTALGLTNLPVVSLSLPTAYRADTSHKPRRRTQSTAFSATSPSLSLPTAYRADTSHKPRRRTQSTAFSATSVRNCVTLSP